MECHICDVVQDFIVVPAHESGISHEQQLPEHCAASGTGSCVAFHTQFATCFFARQKSTPVAKKPHVCC